MLQAFRITAATLNGKKLDINDQSVSGLFTALVDFESMSPSAVGYSDKAKEIEAVLGVFKAEDTLSYTSTATIEDLRILTSREAKKRNKAKLVDLATAVIAAAK